MGAMRLILLLSAVLIFPVVKTLSYSAMENCTSTTSNKHLPIYVVEPTEYHLELFLKPQDDTIRGIANIMIIIYKPIRVIILHAYEVDIDRLQSMITPSFDMSENGITKSARPYEISYCSNTHLVYLRFFGNLKPGTHKLKLTFTTPIGNNKGFVKYPYITRKGTTRWVKILQVNCKLTNAVICILGSCHYYKYHHHLIIIVIIITTLLIIRIIQLLYKIVSLNMVKLFNIQVVRPNCWISVIRSLFA